MSETTLKQNTVTQNLAEHREIDLDGNGRSDYDEILDKEDDEKEANQKKKSKLKKRDVTYNPATIAKDWFMGTDEREME